MLGLIPGGTSVGLLLGEGLNGEVKVKDEERVFALLIKIKHAFGALLEK
jgi:hypothetical protein